MKIVAKLIVELPQMKVVLTASCLLYVMLCLWLLHPVVNSNNKNTGWAGIVIIIIIVFIYIAPYIWN